MRITALVSIAIAMSVLAVQPATADPEKRNHGINKRQDNPKERVAECKDLDGHIDGASRDALRQKHDRCLSSPPTAPRSP